MAIFGGSFLSFLYKKQQDIFTPQYPHSKDYDVLICFFTASFIERVSRIGKFVAPINEERQM